MEAEVVNIPGKGICILLSKINSTDISKIVGTNWNKLASIDLLFTDLAAIADAIRIGHKIQAIKEVRSQTGWGLKEAKEYIDKFFPPSYNNFNDPVAERNGWNRFADNFLNHHRPQVDFINEDDLKM